MLFQFTHHVRDGGRFLADSYVYAFDAGITLVDDRIDCHRGFTGLTVTDDQLTLATADWNHGINRFVTGLYRLVYGLTIDNARSDNFDWRETIVLNRTFTVNWRTQGVHYAA